MNNQAANVAIRIIAYEDRFHPEFKTINLEWLDKYRLTEPQDLAVLDDPRSTILDRGGFIWLAVDGDKVVGTAALVPEGHGHFELAKMAVDVAYRGRGISTRLLETCLAQARATGASRLELFSNHQLTAALHLYRKFGFYDVEVTDSPFETADVKMVLDL